jgi:8-oxo-dGTP pyrophosphatase MutT (NUDIX family)
MIYTCGIFIIDTRDRVLVCHITNQPMEGRTWSIPKGLPDDGESYPEAACREALEETGIRIDPLDVIFLENSPYFSKSMNGKKTLVPFLAVIEESGDDIKCECTSMFTNPKGVQQPEVDDFKWVSFEDAAAIIHESQMVKLEEAKCIYDKYKSDPQIPPDLTPEAEAEWRRNYPIPIEDFGKDWVAQFHLLLLGYKMGINTNISLRQVLNTTRQILINSSGFDPLVRSRTIVVIEGDNGEQWEDYHKWVDSIYEVDTARLQMNSTKSGRLLSLNSWNRTASPLIQTGSIPS